MDFVARGHLENPENKLWGNHLSQIAMVVWIMYIDKSVDHNCLMEHEQGSLLVEEL